MPAVQLKLALCATMLATWRAWNLESDAFQRPGTTRIGVTHPNSEVIAFASAGVPAAFRVACSSRVPPQTIASCVLSDPVR